MTPDRPTQMRYRLVLYGGAVALLLLYARLPATQWRVALSASVVYAACVLAWARIFVKPRVWPATYHPPTQARSFIASLVFVALALIGIWMFKARGATLLFYYLPAVFIVSLVADVVAIRHRFRIERSRDEVERLLRALADGSAGPRDWSLFVFQPIADPELEAIRLRLLAAEREGISRASAARQELAPPAERQAPPAPARARPAGPPEPTGVSAGWSIAQGISERLKLAIAMLVLSTFLGTGSPYRTFYVLGFLGVLLAGAFGTGLLMFRWRHRRNLRALREMQPEHHTRVLEGFPHLGYRARLARDLARDLQSYVSGAVEGFGFADSLKREASAQYWLLACAVAAAFLAEQRIPLAPWARTTGIAVTAVAGFMSLQFLMRWRRYLDTWIEVSRFGIAEVWPDGSRRQIPWRQHLWLDNEPRRRRLHLLIADRSAGIPIHYRRTNFARALQLVIEYGQFTPVPSDGEAPPPAEG